MPLIWLLLLLVPGVSVASLPDPVTTVRVLSESKPLLDQEETVTGYRLLLSAPKRTIDSSYADAETRLDGKLHRRIWELSGREELSALASLLKSALAGSGRVVERFACVDLDCGSSHYWANEVFGNGRLVGRDTRQLYQVLETTSSAGEHQVLVLYAAHRGARQTVVALDWLRTRENLDPGQQAHADLDRLLAASAGWLPGFVVRNGELDQDASAVLLNRLGALAEGLKSRLFLMVHCYESKDMAVNQQCSERLAGQLQAALGNRAGGIRINAQAALSLAPSESLEPALRFVFWPVR